MSGINEKVADEALMFIQGPVWALFKHRYSEYKERLEVLLGGQIRNESWSGVARIQGMKDTIDELIRLSESLPKEIRNGNLDVDAALSVIENKIRHITKE